jgi:F0F1-type ATP synthase assembly protein I
LTPGENAAIIRPLFQVERQEEKIALKVTLLQLLVTLLLAGALYCLEGMPQNAIAVLGGGAVSILNGMLLAWRMARAKRRSVHDAHQQLRLMYFYAAERFLAVVVSLALVLVMQKDAPLFAIGGFVLGQATLISARLLFRIKTESGSENVQ